MFPRLVLIFLLVPILDLFLLLKVGGLLGFWPTVALVILIAVSGAALARHQGLRTLVRIQNELSQGRMPTAELGDGALILLAAALLVTPGFMTDVFALVLLFPPTRAVFRSVLGRYFTARVGMSPFEGIEAGEAAMPKGPTMIFESGAEPPRPMKYVRNEAESGKGVK